MAHAASFEPLQTLGETSAQRTANTNHVQARSNTGNLTKDASVAQAVAQRFNQGPQVIAQQNKTGHRPGHNSIATMTAHVRQTTPTPPLTYPSCGCQLQALLRKRLLLLLSTVLVCSCQQPPLLLSMLHLNYLPQLAFMALIVLINSQSTQESANSSDALCLLHQRRVAVMQQLLICLLFPILQLL